MTPEFIEVCFLDSGPLSDLSNGTLGINSFGGIFFLLLGYVIIRVRVEGVLGYKEDQVALVIPDSAGFGSWVPIMTKREEVDTFLSKIIYGWIKILLLGNNMQVMIQPLKGGDGHHLPHGLSVVNTYTKVISGSKHVEVVGENLMAILITIAKGVKVTQVVVVNVVPPVEIAPGALEKLDEIHGIQQTRMLVEQRRELLFQQLNLSVLDKWSDRNQPGTWALLAEYHDMVSLEPGKLGCMDLAKHEITIVHDEPFKERLQRILFLMVDEVCTHVKEMLEAGAIHPGQSPWCNAVVLVHKKDRDLCFCIDFISLMPEPRKTSIHFPKYMKP